MESFIMFSIFFNDLLKNEKDEETLASFAEAQ
jgi:hypothetical protein